MIFYKDNNIKLYKDDCLKIMKSLSDNSIDLIFTDPPYWSLNKYRNIGTTTRLGGNKNKDKQDDSKWFETIDEEYLFQFMCECYRVLKKGRHALIMCDGQTLKWVLGYAEKAGFDYYKPLVWDKVYQGMGYHFRSRHEFIVLLDKGKNRQPKNLSLSDIITIPMIKGGYPTEKPIGLSKLFIEQYTEIGETVLDPFMGSGSTLIVARELNRFAIGIDISDIAHGITKKRIEKFNTCLF